MPHYGVGFSKYAIFQDSPQSVFVIFHASNHALCTKTSMVTSPLLKVKKDAGHGTGTSSRYILDIQAQVSRKPQDAQALTATPSGQGYAGVQDRKVLLSVLRPARSTKHIKACPSANQVKKIHASLL